MYYLGVDIGGTNLAVGLMDEQFQLLHKDSVPTRAERTDREIVKDIALLCKKVLADNHISRENVGWIGVGVPGCSDNSTGTILYCANIPFLNTPIAKYIQEELDLPVYLGNDADCAALGEAYAGATKDVRDSVMITIGTGVGGGIIIDKHIYNGFNHIGGELGHMVIVADGERCGCGRRGCWEAYGSATGLIRQTKDAIQAHPDSVLAKSVDGCLDAVNGKTAFDAMRAGCPVGSAVVEQYIKYFAAGLTNIINIFQPEIIVIGGGVCKEGDYLLKPLMKHIDAERYGHEGVPKTRICTAQLGNDAGIIGAAALGM